MKKIRKPGGGRGSGFILWIPWNSPNQILPVCSTVNPKMAACWQLCQGSSCYGEHILYCQAFSRSVTCAVLLHNRCKAVDTLSLIFTSLKEHVYSYVLIWAALKWVIQLASVPGSLSVTKVSLCSCPSGVGHDLCYCTPKTNICYTYVCRHLQPYVKHTFLLYVVRTLLWRFSFLQRVWYSIISRVYSRPVTQLSHEDDTRLLVSL